MSISYKCSMNIQSWKCGVAQRNLDKRNRRRLSYGFKLRCQPRNEEVRVDVALEN